MAAPKAEQPQAYGALHSGYPAGRVTNLHGLDCYVADAPDSDPKGIVVLIPGTSSWDMSNNRVLADSYAKRGGFQVLLPDFTNGTAVPEDVQTSFKAMRKLSYWRNPLAKLGHLLYVLRCMLPFVYHCRPGVAGPRISAFLYALKQHEAKDLPVGAAGFAWGGYFVIRACWEQTTSMTAGGGRIIDCAFVAHPSNTKFPEDVERIERPISWAAAETCRHMSPQQAIQTEQILRAKTGKGQDCGIGHEFVMYRGVNYGFAQGSDRKKIAEAEAGRKAEEQAVDWFVKCFTNLQCS